MNGHSLFPYLPADVLLRILEGVPLDALPRCCAALQLSCHAWAHAVHALLETLVATRLNPSVPVASKAQRRSARCHMGPPEHFAQAVRALRVRTESMHHALACVGQDSRDLTAGRVKKLHVRWQPCLLDRPSPTYDATMLMEACRARGVHEGAIVAAATELVRLGASPSATNTEGCSPLIIASARGLPRVVALLLTCGADPRQRGLGRFRLADSRQSLRGRHTAREWVRALLDAEADIGVTGKQQRSLIECHSLLLAVEACVEGEAGASGPAHLPCPRSEA